MKTKIILSLALVTFGILTTSCEGETDDCVQNYMNEGLSKTEAQDKCDEALMESVEVLR